MELDLLGPKNLIPGYTTIQIPFCDASGASYQMDYIVCDRSVSDVLHESVIGSQIKGITRVSDRVFPPTRLGAPMHLAHQKLVLFAQRFAAISPQDSEEIVGFYFLNKRQQTIANNSFSILNVNALGIDPDYQGKRLMETSCSKIIEHEQAELVHASTIHPAVYKAFSRLAEEYGYQFFPKDVDTPDWAVVLGLSLLPPATIQHLDRMLVRRSYMPMAVQGQIPYHGFKLFEQDFNLSPRDGVLMMLVKPELVEWIQKQFPV